ncbi:MAG: DUF6290 family protein [Peptoniphilus sp.]|nr:DUF6290 family protein [Peptoniphilus sp.]MDY3119224.1 DUF6290 family protein [Peptoniphilus sp.]
MTTLTIRLNDRDKRLFQRAAEIQGKSLSDWARESLLEKIEDEYDRSVYEAYLQEEAWKDARSIDDLIHELDFVDEL